MDKINLFLSIGYAAAEKAIFSKIEAGQSFFAAGTRIGDFLTQVTPREAACVIVGKPQPQTITATETTMVGVPNGVTATPGDGQVTISWNPVTGAQSYNIYWATTSGVTKSSNQLANKTSPYIHTSSATSTGGGFGEFSIKAGLRAALTNGKIYYYAVTAGNSSGESNLSTEVSATPKTGTVTDTTPPVISAVTSGSLAQTSAMITWTTDEDSTSQVEYGTTTTYGSTTTLVSTKTKSHSVSVTTLTAATAYHYRVKSKDAAGNEGASTDNIFTTTGGVVQSNPLEADLGGGVKMKFAEISPGTFQMGQAGFQTGSYYYGDSEPVHQVNIRKAFYMGIYEVTQSQYETLIGTNPSNLRHPGSGNQPVHLVPWNAAANFCNKLSECQGLKACYTNQTGNTNIGPNDTVVCDWNISGYRLPTEAEWEYACRANTTTQYYWGDSVNGDYLWYGGNSQVDYYPSYFIGTARYGPHDVGTKLPNPWGLYDMSGNEWEWCWDYYDERGYSNEEQTDPRGPIIGYVNQTEIKFAHVIRNGSFFPNFDGGDVGWQYRSASRYLQTGADGGSGFRICRTKQ